MPIESDWPLQVAKMTRKNGDSTIKLGEEHLKEPIFHSSQSICLASVIYIYIYIVWLYPPAAGQCGIQHEVKQTNTAFSAFGLFMVASTSFSLTCSRWFHSCQSLNSNAIQLMARTPKMTQHRLLTDPITRNSTIVSTKGPALGFVINENVLPSSDLWLADSRLHPEAPMFLQQYLVKESRINN